VAGKQRACYVRLPNAPLGIWKAWKRGKYPKLEDYSVFAGRAVRFGAYGDPVFIPWRVVRAITAYARKWTGYTHQWRNPLFDGFKAFLMASTEDLAGTAQAQSQGWRTFRVSPALDPMAGEIICPNTTRGITCEACGLCAGTARQAKSIVIESHGNGRNYV
jgi:hypothetical protein